MPRVVLSPSLVSLLSSFPRIAGSPHFSLRCRCQPRFLKAFSIVAPVSGFIVSRAPSVRVSRVSSEQFVRVPLVSS